MMMEMMMMIDVKVKDIIEILELKDGKIKDMKIKERALEK